MMWELTLLPFEEITRGLPPPASRPARSTRTQRSVVVARGRNSNSPKPTTPQTGFQRAGVAPSQTPPRQAAAAPPADDPPADSAAAADGFLINGSVNNGAASPFAQPVGLRQQSTSPRRALQRHDRRSLQQLAVGRPSLLTDRHPDAPTRLLQRSSARGPSAVRSRFHACRIA